jgi:hypothetical protein
MSFPSNIQSFCYALLQKSEKVSLKNTYLTVIAIWAKLPPQIVAISKNNLKIMALNAKPASSPPSTNNNNNEEKKEDSSSSSKPSKSYNKQKGHKKRRG